GARPQGESAQTSACRRTTDASGARPSVHRPRLPGEVAPIELASLTPGGVEGAVDRLAPALGRVLVVERLLQAMDPRGRRRQRLGRGGVALGGHRLPFEDRGADRVDRPGRRLHLPAGAVVAGHAVDAPRDPEADGDLAGARPFDGGAQDEDRVWLGRTDRGRGHVLLLLRLEGSHPTIRGLRGSGGATRSCSRLRPGVSAPGGATYFVLGVASSGHIARNISAAMRGFTDGRDLIVPHLGKCTKGWSLLCGQPQIRQQRSPVRTFHAGSPGPIACRAVRYGAGLAATNDLGLGRA